jgi:iron complex transport system substrate-binding protein
MSVLSELISQRGGRQMAVGRARRGILVCAAGSAYTAPAGDHVPPARREKPKVSAFTSAKIEKILGLRPDLVLGFSDLQAQIAQERIQTGVNVLVFNQRSAEEILEMILTLSRIVSAESAGMALVERLRGVLDRIEESAERFPRRPRVFFEEWMEPLISGIRWVEKLIEIAGGRPVFPKLREQHSAKVE